MHLRLRGYRPAVDLFDQFLVERRDVQDVRRHLHDHGLRPADPLQRRLLRPHGSAHPTGKPAQASEACRALLPHPRARSHFRHSCGPARSGQPGLHVRRRLLGQPALHVLGIRQERRVVPALPDHLRRHPGQALRRRPGRTFALAFVHQCAERVPRELFPAAYRHLRDHLGHRRRRQEPWRQRAADRLPLPRTRRDLDPRRSLAHLSLGCERRRTGRSQPQAPATRGRHRVAAALKDRSRQGRGR